MVQLRDPVGANVHRNRRIMIPKVTRRVMNRKPLVSIITIFLNEEKFIQEAIESILAQTYDNWELLLVDDGSTDKSSDIARRYAEKFPGKIRYLEHDGHKNRGISTSRNVAIQNAKGEYIAFLDGDDIYLPDKLERQVAILESNPTAAFVCGRTERWYSWTGKTEDTHRDFLQKLDVPLDTVIKPPALLLMWLQDERAALTADVTVRRATVLQVGGYEDSFRDMHEDQAFHAKLCLDHPGFVSSACWYRYRKHPASTTHIAKTTGQWATARQTFLNWLEKYLSEREIQNDEVWQVLQKEKKKLWHYRHPNLSRIQRGIRKVARIPARLGILR